MFPAWLTGFVIGCVHGSICCCCIASREWRCRREAGSRDDWLALAIAVAGTTGGMALMIVGNTSNDMTVSLFVLLALLLMRPARGYDVDAWRFVAAGLPAAWPWA